MKLRLSKETSEKMRKLSDVYNVPLQRIARAASIAFSKCRDIQLAKTPTNSEGTVIDVSDDYDQSKWRGVIDWYCDREISRIDVILGDLIAKERQRADAIRASLPKYKIEG